MKICSYLYEFEPFAEPFLWLGSLLFLPSQWQDFAKAVARHWQTNANDCAVVYV
ncbi:hypothetical protein [Bacteroides oleiciplenus]|uniref:hypothetical protein n=1 Tax=Bacteroides oleiciplenus TaxID=626931 RepID=UPI0015F34854|nr:hypothetical protein [Bacteroides oleiciplenus]